MAGNGEKKTVRCSFCNRTQSQVGRIIEGNGVFICEECVRQCQEILGDTFDDDNFSRRIFGDIHRHGDFEKILRRR